MRSRGYSQTLVTQLNVCENTKDGDDYDDEEDVEGRENEVTTSGSGLDKDFRRD